MSTDGAPLPNVGSEQPDGRLQLLSVKQAAARLHCSPANVYALVERGELAVVRVGKSKGYRIDLRDLDAFVGARKVRYVNESPKVPRRKLKHIRR